MLPALVENTSGANDNLVYRIGLSDNEIKNGKQDAIASDPAALWVFESAGNGYVYARNMSDGQYLQIETTLSVEPVSFRPYYAKQDNGKMAFFMDATEEAKRLFNVGTMDSDGKGGVLEFFSIHADRTRLRWVFEETDIEAVLPTPTVLRSVEFRNNVQTNLYNLQGMPLNQQPSSGVYLERTTDDAGNVSIKKKMAQ